MINPSGSDETRAPTSEQSAGAADRFEWHPRYGGRTVRDVHQELKNEIERDQRAYGLVIEAAERDEKATLVTVIELERKWGAVDMDWATANSTELADRVVAFEQERERRRELFPYAEFRASRDRLMRAAPAPGRRADAVGGAVGSRSRLIIGLLVVAVVVVVVLLALS